MFPLNPILKSTATMGSCVRHLHLMSALCDRLTCFRIHYHSESNNLVSTFISVHISMVSEPQTIKLFLFNFMKTLVLKNLSG